MPTAVQRYQFLSAVAQLADQSLLMQAIPADVNDPLWIAYNSANCVLYGDALCQLTQAVYGWDQSDMVDLFKVAQLTPTACSGNTP